MGRNISNEKDSVLFDTVTKQWTQMPELNDERNGASSAVVNNQVFILGGQYKSSVESLKLDEVDPQWKVEPPMKQARWYASSAVINDCIYTTGGRDKNIKCFSSGEFLDVRTNIRGNIPDMIVPRRNHALLAAKGKLFAIGGYNEKDKYLSSSECFDFNKPKWSLIAPMKYCLDEHAAVVLDDHIFVTGGWQDGPVSSVIKYNIFTDTWSDVAPMNKGRRGHCASVVNGKIYVVGGYCGGPVTSIEVFDPTNNKWTIIAETKSEIFYATMIGV